MFCYTLFWLWWQWWCWYDGSDNIRPQFKGAGFVAPAKMMHLPVYTCHEDSPPKSFLPELISIPMVCGNETFDQWHIFFLKFGHVACDTCDCAWQWGTEEVFRLVYMFPVKLTDNQGRRFSKPPSVLPSEWCGKSPSCKPVSYFFTGSLTQRCWCMKIRPRDVDSCIDCLDTSTNWSHKYFLNTVSESAIST